MARLGGKAGGGVREKRRVPPLSGGVGEKRKVQTKKANRSRRMSRTAPQKKRKHAVNQTAAEKKKVPSRGWGMSARLRRRHCEGPTEKGKPRMCRSKGKADEGGKHRARVNCLLARGDSILSTARAGKKISWALLWDGRRAIAGRNRR